jgi:hypothetical protein
MLLVDTVLDDTLVAIGRLLRLEVTAGSTYAAFGIIHNLLERVVLPAKDVAAMLTVAGGVSCRKVKGCEPSVGQSAWLLNLDVSYTICYGIS